MEADRHFRRLAGGDSARRQGTWRGLMPSRSYRQGRFGAAFSMHSPPSLGLEFHLPEPKQAEHAQPRCLPVEGVQPQSHYTAVERFSIPGPFPFAAAFSNACFRLGHQNELLANGPPARRRPSPLRETLAACEGAATVDSVLCSLSRFAMPLGCGPVRGNPRRADLRSELSDSFRFEQNATFQRNCRDSRTHEKGKRGSGFPLPRCLSVRVAASDRTCRVR